MGIIALVDLEATGAKVHVGSVHYNTVEEIKRFGEAMGRVAENAS
jgi:selenocysteine lyase/cysteine desulfurase